MTNVPHHIETSQMICNANQLTGFYMRATLELNGLKESMCVWVTGEKDNVWSLYWKFFLLYYQE